jgi:GNAT superfamily N-acetyltransferase
MDFTIERFSCDQPQSEASRALAAWLDATDTDRSYLPMMQYRVAGKAAQQCEDIYYIAMQDGKAISRLWHGWGRHPNAVGNFGNFMTLEELRGQGIGRKMLDTWYEDLNSRTDRPLGLFCSSLNGYRVEMYRRYGFTQAVIMPSSSFLYKPLNGSPENFRELCEEYYCSANTLTVRPATVEWRHEIDCLLKYTLTDLGIKFGLPGCASLEETIVWPEKGTGQTLFTEKNRPVGWSFTPTGGETVWQIHPKFQAQFEATCL